VWLVLKGAGGAGKLFLKRAGDAGQFLLKSTGGAGPRPDRGCSGDAIFCANLP